MRRVKKEKRNKVLIFSVIILLLVCAGIAIASLHKVNNILLENSSEATIEIIGNSSTTEPAQELRGTVKDATMNTLDNFISCFSRKVSAKKNITSKIILLYLLYAIYFGTACNKHLSNFFFQRHCI